MHTFAVSALNNATLLATSFSGGSSFFTGQSANGTAAAPAAVTTGGELVRFSACGFDGTQFTGSRAAIVMRATENWTANANGTDLSFETAPNGTSGASARVERLRITNDGNVGIGTATPELGLEVVGPSTAQIAATAHGSTALFLGRSANGTPAAEMPKSPNSVQRTPRWRTNSPFSKPAIRPAKHASPGSRAPSTPRRPAPCAPRSIGSNLPRTSRSHSARARDSGEAPNQGKSRYFA